MREDWGEWLLDFLERILQVDPGKRLSAFEALHHPFIVASVEGRPQGWMPPISMTEEAICIDDWPAFGVDVQPARPSDLSEYEGLHNESESLYGANAGQVASKYSMRPRHGYNSMGRRVALPYPESDESPHLSLNQGRQHALTGRVATRSCRGSQERLY